MPPSSATLAAVLLAILVWGMPVQLAVMATLNGMVFGLFPIVWIVITAIWVYNMTVESRGVRDHQKFPGLRHR